MPARNSPEVPTGPDTFSFQELISLKPYFPNLIHEDEKKLKKFFTKPTMLYSEFFLSYFKDRKGKKPHVYKVTCCLCKDKLYIGYKDYAEEAIKDFWKYGWVWFCFSCAEKIPMRKFHFTKYLIHQIKQTAERIKKEPRK